MTEYEPLVVEARKGDPEAFASLVDRFQDMAVGCAFSWVKDFETARDVAQEAFLEAWLSLGGLKEPAAFPGWFRRVVTKHADRVTRKRKAGAVTLDEAPEPLSDGCLPDGEMERRESRALVHAALRELPEAEREAATLFYLGSYTREEVAHLLQVPLETIVYRLRSARRTLKERMLTMSKNTLRSAAPSNGPEFKRDVMARLRGAEQFHATFAKSLAETLSERSGIATKVEMAFADMTTYDEMVAWIRPYPALSWTLRMEPLDGNAILTLFAPVVERAMGWEAATGGFTDEQTRASAVLTDPLLGALERTWETHEVRLTSPRVELDVASLRLAEADASVVLVAMEVAEREGIRLGPDGEAGRRPGALLCYPVETIASLLPVLG